MSRIICIWNAFGNLQLITLVVLQLTEGSGSILVVAVGTNTEYGKTMSLVMRESASTPLQEHLETLAASIGKVGFCVAVVCFVVLLVRCVCSAKQQNLSHSPSTAGRPCCGASSAAANAHERCSVPNPPQPCLTTAVNTLRYDDTRTHAHSQDYQHLINFSTAVFLGLLYLLQSLLLLGCTVVDLCGMVLCDP